MPRLVEAVAVEAGLALGARVDLKALTVTPLVLAEIPELPLA
jgi:hypothetical protein